MARKIVFLIVLTIIGFLIPSNALAQRGCCSWHDGVSYCDTSVGRYVCNDGTYSPSCGCYRAPQVIQPPAFPLFLPCLFQNLFPASIQVPALFWMNLKGNACHGLACQEHIPSLILAGLEILGLLM